MGNAVGVSFVSTTGEDLLATAIMMETSKLFFGAPMGMYRLSNFHSDKAPKLKDNENTIYIENVLEENAAGWTPLHTCCMSLGTVQSGLLLIDEMQRLGGSFEVKTLQGPGHFNRGWTPLHMACAYGVDKLVDKLVACGANVNSTNSYGFSCLLEACHRGFLNVVKALVQSPHLDLRYIPSEEDSRMSPFSCAPCQSALAEAARCGFYPVVQVLVDAGAPKDLKNSIGWTALHEACFYNRVETVKTLLLSGASASVRTRLGALPFHLSGLQEIKTMPSDMGGRDAVPDEQDRINMVDVLTELTMPEVFMHGGQGGGNLFGEDMFRSSRGPSLMDDPNRRVVHKSDDGAAASSSSSPSSSSSISRDYKDDKHSDSSPSASGAGRGERDHFHTPASLKSSLLHSGAMLGDLPSLGSNADRRSLSAMADDKRGHDGGSGGGSGGAKKKKDKNKRRSDKIPADMPTGYLCSLTQQPMAEPVKSVYGHLYEKAAIEQWFHAQGRICPLTGAPLSFVDLQPMTELGEEIRDWIYKGAMAPASPPSHSASASSAPPRQGGGTAKGSSQAADDLYDF